MSLGMICVNLGSLWTSSVGREILISLKLQEPVPLCGQRVHCRSFVVILMEAEGDFEREGLGAS